MAQSGTGQTSETVARPSPAADALREALELIARPGCENYAAASGWRCWDGPDRIRGAQFTAEAWCNACIAQDALGRP